MTKLTEWDRKAPIKSIKANTGVSVDIWCHMTRTPTSTIYPLVKKGKIPTKKGLRGNVIILQSVKDTMASFKKYGLSPMYAERLKEEGFNTKPFKKREPSGKKRKSRKDKKNIDSGEFEFSMLIAEIAVKNDIEVSTVGIVIRELRQRNIF